MQLWYVINWRALNYFTSVVLFVWHLSFFIISPTDQQVHCWSWIKSHMPNDPQLHLEDVSWKYTGERERVLISHIFGAYFDFINFFKLLDYSFFSLTCQPPHPLQLLISLVLGRWMCYLNSPMFLWLRSISPLCSVRWVAALPVCQFFFLLLIKQQIGCCTDDFCLE